MYMVNEVMGLKPQLGKGVFVAPNAQIIGDVRLLEGANVWYNAVLRGDVASITVGHGSNTQDNCTLHCDMGVPLVIGDNVTVGHNTVLHCCTIGNGTLIGMGTVLLSGVKIGSGCIIAAGSVVTPRTVVPDGSLFMGNPAKLERMLSDVERDGLINKALEYTKFVTKYKMQETVEILKNCVLSKGLSQSRLFALKNLAE
jgi:carbonic anhydrase/acetyltransferase-like protein (isoleucine patch superfamily)